MRSEILQKILDETPLRNKFKVELEMFLINAITELGFRPAKSWDEENEEEERLLKTISKLASEKAQRMVETVKKTKPEMIQ